MNHIIKKSKKNISLVDAILLGEHGETAFISKHLSSINGEAFDKIIDEHTSKQLIQVVIASAKEIKKTQKATIYGVGFCAMHIFDALLTHSERKIPVSTFIPDYLKKIWVAQTFTLASIHA